MTVEQLQWLIGTAVTVIAAIGTIAFTAFRSMAGRLDKAVTELRRAIKDQETAAKDGDDKLHERVNRVRDEYLPRRDHDDHMARIDLTLNEIRKDQKSMLQAVVVLAGRPIEPE